MPLKIFVSYARRDREHLLTLKREVEAVKADHSIFWLTDESLRAGDVFDETIDAMIRDAHAWVLLLSPRFRDSEYCGEKELPVILDVMESGRLCPIVLEAYQRSDRLEKVEKMVEIIGMQEPILDGGDRGTTQQRWHEAASRLVSDLAGLARERGFAPLDKLEYFRRDMLRGAFTPYLGPVCYELSEYAKPGLPHLRSRMTRLRDELGDDPEALAFAGSVADSKRLGPGGASDTDPKPGALPSGLLALQAAITRLGAAVWRIYRKTSGEARESRGGREDSTPALEEADLEALALAMQQARAAARKVPEKSTCPALHGRLCVGASGISRKLRTLDMALFGEEAPESEALRRKTPGESVEVRMEAARIRLGAGPSETLVYLEWAKDLLWHTLRFDAPLFPSPTDLAFQLSLCADSPDCISRMPLGLASAVCEPEESLEFQEGDSCVSMMVRRLDDLSAERRVSTPEESLCGSLAAMLAAAHTADIASRSTNGRPSSRTAAPVERADYVTVADEAERREGEGCQPLLLSSNLDRDIELQLEAHGVPYFVLFPISYREGTRERRPGWMLSSSRGQCYFVDARVDTIEQVASAVRVADQTSRRLPGPLIVRLRGAPLVSLPSAGSVRPILGAGDHGHGPSGTARYTHRILLSCLEFTREFTAFRRFPEFVRNLMTEDRALCFLGHGLDELDSLFGLMPEAWQGIGADVDRSSKYRTAGHADKRVGVGFGSGDEVRNAMVRRLGITPLKIELQDVGPALSLLLRESRE